MTDLTPDPHGPVAEPSRVLDGNAAAGPLAEIFVIEPTVVHSTCAHCGTPAALGAHHLFADAPGVVVRCPSCTEVVLRFARVGDGSIALDLRGSALLVFPGG